MGGIDVEGPHEPKESCTMAGLSHSVGLGGGILSEEVAGVLSAFLGDAVPAILAEDERIEP